jgi:transmembrane sensor
MNERLNFLVEGYLNDSLSITEWEELKGLLKASKAQDLDPVLRSLYELPALPLAESESQEAKQSVWDALQSYIEQDVQAEIGASAKMDVAAIGVVRDRPSRRTFGMPLWVRYAAAVLILGSTAWVAYSVWGRKTIAVQPSTVLSAEAVRGKLLPPSGAGATLTLANGSTVALTPNASLPALKGSSARLDSGMLVYQYYNSTKTLSKDSFNTLSTSKGMQFQLVLPDGSHVWLNSASSIKYPVAFSGSKREVELTGQAYFDIAQDKAKPFVVKAGRIQIDVLGTSFDVMAYADEPMVQASLFHGAVKVSAKDKSLVLQPGQQVVCDAVTMKAREANLEVVGAWRKGMFLFKKTRLEEIMRQIARWYDVDVEYQGAMPDISFTGALSRKDDAQQLLDILESTNNVHFITQGKKIIVTQ